MGINMYDIAIIGAGVTGCAIARELSRYKAKICVIDRCEDVCCGTSKANSAIIHAGYDAEPGSLKARLNVTGNAMMDALAEELDFSFKRNGSLVLCFDEKDRGGLDELYERGVKNGVPNLRIIESEELKRLEPNVSDEAVAALYAPTGGIVCPFGLTIALAENAANNGAEFLLETEVSDISADENGYTLKTVSRAYESEGREGELRAKCVINAAGVYADAIHNMVSERKISITARRGCYFLLDKSAGGHVSRTIFTLPGPMGKGILTAPTVHGNILVGPDALDTEDKESVCTTAEELESVRNAALHNIKNLPLRKTITSFAGLRAHEAGGDFVIGECEDAKLFFDCAGIESPGLSASPAIGVMLAELVSTRMGLEKNEAFNPIRKGIINPALMSSEERNELIKKNPAYGNIICRCEMITEGEIIDAIHRPVGAKSLDAVKRRTRAGMGRCQSGFCAPKVMDIIARELNVDLTAVTKNGGRSQMIINEDVNDKFRKL